jgi:prevent-host-death family protein
MRTISITEAETRLSQLIEQAAAGEEIVIAKAGKPMARLMPLAEQTEPPRRVLGLGRGRLRVPENFNSLHAETIRKMFEGIDSE